MGTNVDPAAAQETAELLGEPAWAMGLDARNAHDHRAAAAAAAERGMLKVWVNNAGVARPGKGFEDADDDVRLTVETNLPGVMWGSRAAIEGRRSRGGHGIHIAHLARGPEDARPVSPHG